MSHGRVANELYRMVTQQAVPAGVSKRQKCDTCRITRSIGQFPVDQSTCVQCNPKPAGWRRGGF